MKNAFLRTAPGRGRVKNEDHAGKVYTILVIDDEPGLCDIYQNNLSGSYNVLTATSATEGWEILQTEKIHLILLDIMMPGVSGLEFCEKIMKDIRFKFIPVIFVSAKLDPSDIVLGLELGANDYLTKPVNKEEMLIRVKTQLRILETDSEKQELLEHLFQSERFSSIGRLAIAVGHEINNPLAIILGNLEMIEDYHVKRKDLDDQFALCIEKQKKAISRIGNIVNELRTYARADSNIREKVDLHRVLDDTLELVMSLVRSENIEFRKEYDPTGATIGIDIGRLQQVFINLLLNARDAMEGRSEKLLTIKTVSSGQCVITEFSDTGCGIKEEDLGKIFNTFYTTKGCGSGTGLGLSISKSIIEDMDGSIEVESRQNAGATFRIRLPRVEGTGREKHDLDRKKAPVEKFTGEVLVVDDEPDIRELLRDFLSDLGFEVDEASDGDIALEKIKAKHFEYVLTDIKMPRMSGIDLIMEAKKLNLPKTRFIAITASFITEFPTKELGELRELVDGYIRKPFSRSDVLEILQRLSGDQQKIDSKLQALESLFKDYIKQRKILTIVDEKGMELKNVVPLSFKDGYLECVRPGSKNVLQFNSINDIIIVDEQDPRSRLLYRSALHNQKAMIVVCEEQYDDCEVIDFCFGGLGIRVPENFHDEDELLTIKMGGWEFHGRVAYYNRALARIGVQFDIETGREIDRRLKLSRNQ